MGKPEMTFDEAKEALSGAKDANKAAKTELKSFDKKNKVKKGDDSDLKKDAKKERKLLAETAAAASAKVQESKELVKSLKPKKDRVSKYEYPEDIKGDSKAEKRYRASMRGKAKSAGMTVEEYLGDPAKGDAAIEAAKKSKKADKPKKDKKDKKEKKDKKDKKEKSEEDED